MKSFKPDYFRELKTKNHIFSAITVTDYPTARLLDACSLDLLLVGDSLGMVVLGYPDTTRVTLAEMVHHTKAAARGIERTPLAADLPAGTYGTAAQAVTAARELQQAGAGAVKLEGGVEVRDQVCAILDAGIPVIGHLGMLPQRVLIEGGYSIKGRTAAEAGRLAEDARVLEEAGVTAIVLELVSPPLAEQITRDLAIPTFGIGSGPNCDGQIRVLHDVIGLFPWFRPRFVDAKADVAGDIQRAVQEFRNDIGKARHTEFPG